MKKMIALLLSLALLSGCFAAVAENPDKTQLGSITLNGAFKLQCNLPAGYTVQIQEKDSEGLHAVIESEDSLKPVMYLAIEFDELYYDVKRMNDLTEEQLQAIANTFEIDGDEVNITYKETSHGSKLMMATDAQDAVDFVSFISVYVGYMIEFDMLPGQTAEGGLTEEQIQMCIDFLSDLDFIPVEA